MLGLAAWAFSSCNEQGLLFIAMCGLLTSVPFVAEHGLYSIRASVVVACGCSILSS